MCRRVYTQTKNKHEAKDKTKENQDLTKVQCFDSVPSAAIMQEKYAWFSLVGGLIAAMWFFMLVHTNYHRMTEVIIKFMWPM